jgi:hypothetical protein
MTYPTEIDWALIKMGDGATPTEAFVLLCGMQDATVNTTAQTQDRYVRDCAKPGSVPKRKVKVTGLGQAITGTGLTNADNIDDLQAALGRHKNFKIEAYADDGTDAGHLLGTFAGNYVMTAHNLNLQRENAGSSEITLASDGDWTWTPAT